MAVLIAGVDEVGRGPLAGPVVAAAAAFKIGYRNRAIRDSKKLSASQREELLPIIQRDAVAYAVVAVGHRRIERWNIREASKIAMSLAVRRLRLRCAPVIRKVLVDGNMPIMTDLPQVTVIGGDDKHVQISAASILAKVWRDQLMAVLDRRYPGYGLGVHCGYATASHRSALLRLGPSPIHRRTFHGVLTTQLEIDFALAEDQDFMTDLECQTFLAESEKPALDPV